MGPPWKNNAAQSWVLPHYIPTINRNSVAIHIIFAVKYMDLVHLHMQIVDVFDHLAV